MSCKETQKYLHLFLDGELDERDQGEIEGHLRSCLACREQVKFEQWFRKGLRKSCGEPTAPAHLASKIRRELSAISQPRRPRWGVLAPVAAVLVLGVLLGYVWSLYELTPTVIVPHSHLTEMLPRRSPVVSAPAMRAPVEETKAIAVAMKSTAPTVEPEPAPKPKATTTRSKMARVVLTHTASNRAPGPDKEEVGERALPVEIRSADPEQIKAFLKEKLALNIDVPTFHGRARVVGGSADEADATAQVVYRYRQQHLTLQVRRNRGANLPKRGIVVRQEGTHQVALWRRNGLTYSLTSLLDPVEMVKLVASELHPTPNSRIARRVAPFSFPRQFFSPASRRFFTGSGRLLRPTPRFFSTQQDRSSTPGAQRVSSTER